MAEPTEADIGQVLAAHARRSQQLTDARAALAEAVQTLRDELAGNRVELGRVREQARAQAAEITRLKAEITQLNAEITKLAAYAAQVEQEARETHAAYASLHGDLVALQTTKLMRWSAPWRAAVQRLRSRRSQPDGA